jgi:tetratricopeptide (TPR) repeat protein
MVSLYQQRFDDVFSSATKASAIRDVSILKLALDAASAPDMHYGIIEFTSVPCGARVFVNNVMQGTTPMVIAGTAGEHEVSLNLDGYEPWHGVFAAKEMKITSVEAQLTPVKSAGIAVMPHRTAAASSTAPSGNGASDGFITRPEYVEALIHLTIGEYLKALSLLDSLARIPGLTNDEKAAISEKTALCYQGLGDFRRALQSLEKRFASASDPDTRGNLLWQIATIKTTCLGDVQGGRQDLAEYLKSYPNGSWTQEARQKLAQIEPMLAR